MGAIILPLNGSVYLDANGFIYTVEKIDPFYTKMLPLWRTVATRHLNVRTSEITLLETLVKPLRLNAVDLVQAYREVLFQSPDVHLLAITQAILLRAAELRATMPSLKTPDAIHVATAIEAGCSLFVTNDSGLRNVPDLPVALITELGDVTP